MSLLIDKTGHFIGIPERNLPSLQMLGGTRYNYNALTDDQTWEYAQRVYANHPELLETARQTMFEL